MTRGHRVASSDRFYFRFLFKREEDNGAIPMGVIYVAEPTTPPPTHLSKTVDYVQLQLRAGQWQTQCDQFGQFSKVLVNKFSHKSWPNICWLLGLFWKWSLNKWKRLLQLLSHFLSPIGPLFSLTSGHTGRGNERGSQVTKIFAQCPVLSSFHRPSWMRPNFSGYRDFADLVSSLRDENFCFEPDSQNLKVLTFSMLLYVPIYPPTQACLILP